MVNDVAKIMSDVERILETQKDTKSTFLLCCFEFFAEVESYWERWKVRDTLFFWRLFEKIPAREALEKNDTENWLQ